MLPFTHDAFLDTFALYNVALWPVALLLWLATAALVAAWLSRRRVSAAAALWLLAAHWGWSAVAYHWFFFRAINPAATGFAVAFMGQAVVFAVLAARAGAQSRAAEGWRFGAGAALAVYGLLYPVIGLAFGLQYPRMPVFGVPCPTSLVTAGLLMGAVRVPRPGLVVPALWCAIGGSAAFVLGVRADLALLVAGALLVTELLSSRQPSAA